MDDRDNKSTKTLSQRLSHRDIMDGQNNELRKSKILF